MWSRKLAFWILAAQFLAIGYFLFSVLNAQWKTSIWTLCVAVAIPCWLLAVKVRTVV